jgi:hypothetical protein
LNPEPGSVSPEATGVLTASSGEIALFVGAALLTLLVVAFVIGLIVTIVREERAAGSDELDQATSGSNDASETQP